MWISGNMATGYNMAQVFNLVHTKLTFGKFDLHLMLLKFPKNSMQILHMLLNICAEHKYIVKIYKEKNVQCIWKHSMNNFLKGFRSIA